MAVAALCTDRVGAASEPRDLQDRPIAAPNRAGTPRWNGALALEAPLEWGLQPVSLRQTLGRASPATRARDGGDDGANQSIAIIR